MLTGAIHYIYEKDNTFLVRRRAVLSDRSRNVKRDASHVVAGGWEKMNTVFVTVKTS